MPFMNNHNLDVNMYINSIDKRKKDELIRAGEEYLKNLHDSDYSYRQSGMARLPQPRDRITGRDMSDRDCVIRTVRTILRMIFN